MVVACAVNVTMTEQTVTPPPVMWAQRSAVVFLTVNLEDIQNAEVKFTKDSVYFKGIGGVEKKLYEVNMPLYKEIDPEKSKYFDRGRCMEMVLAKVNQSEEYWPTLTSDKKKHHWLKCDFNKWQDEDDSGDEGLGGMGEGGDFEEMMRRMGGLDTTGGGGGSSKPSFDDLDEDSDDEPLPDLE